MKILTNQAPNFGARFCASCTAVPKFIVKSTAIRYNKRQNKGTRSIPK
ncbi:hypothetical protein HMPREF9436_02675 [Faecalibacterium cf. prausnitzii KLE1255]|uniref:Uncharacterized protein n=1 Tax=Faecalibacterium cf. prausnitzii KLE1255 TaxID=748224 RepID=E2ZLW4_9FIRM|nr:hypothetical protein HMPREF9436_02675 [Faecalibacterium cf. prausnitzii KLE1255]